MATLFVLEQGAKVGKTSKRIVIEKDRQVLLEIPEFKIDKVFIFGNVQVSTQALRFFLEHSKDVSFFTMSGKFLGKFLPYSSKNVLLRMKQYDMYRDAEQRVEISKVFIKAKLKNCRTVLQKYFRSHNEVDLSEEISRIEEIISAIDRKSGLSALLGLEGMGSCLYFKGFAKMIRNEGFVFDSRTRRPPRDPVNSLLSLGYSILTSEMFAVLFALGFDPYVGVFHSLEYSRPSLALDLIEELRPVIVDRFAMDLINNKIIHPEDFEEVKTEDETSIRIFLSSEGRKVFFRHYEQRMQAKVTYLEEEVTYRQLLERKARNFAGILEGKEEYKPFLLK